MIKPILAISFCALFVTACGGSSNSTSTGTSNGGGTTTGGGTTGGGTTTPSGPAPSFGDTAASSGLTATTTVCPASVTSSFTGWAKSNGNWCAYKCPAGFENDDGDDWGFFTSNQNACRVTSAAAGATITADIFTPDGERIYISDNADPSNGGTYSCADWEYNEISRVWEQISSPAPFTLTLSANNSGNDAGTATTWSFSAGTLSLETGRTMTNVAVGNNAFSSWKSNTALTRCST